LLGLDFRANECMRRRVLARRRVVLNQQRPKEKQNEDYSLEKLGFIEVGLIVGPHGVRGGAKVRSLSDFPQQRLAEPNSLRHIKYPDRLYPRPIQLVKGTKAAQKDMWIVFLDGYNSPEEVKEIRGARICVKVGDKPKVKKGEYYVRDLIGLKVRLYGSGALIGSVNDIYTNDELARHIKNPSKLGHDMLEVMVDNEEDNLVLVPFVKQIVPVVNIEDGEVLIDPPEGLFDIAKVNLIVKRSAPRLFLNPAADEHPQQPDEE